MAMAAFAVVLAVGVAYFLHRRYPEATRRWFQRIKLTRQLVWGVFLLSLAFVLLQSGITSLVLVGAIVVGYAALFIIFERPHDAIRDVLGV